MVVVVVTWLVTVALGFARFTGSLLNTVVGLPSAPLAEKSKYHTVKNVIFDIVIAKVMRSFKWMFVIPSF